LATLGLAASLLVTPLSGCAGPALRAHPAPAPRLERFRVPTMGTVLEVAVPAGPRAELAARVVFDTFAEVDQDMSEWRPDSPLTRVNDAAGAAAVSVPAEVLALVRRGLEIGDLTGGAFDITWAALWGLWDFQAETPQVPEPQEIAARVARVDYRRVEVDLAARTLRLPDKGMALGTGGIAKGWALDLAAQRLRDAGVSDYLVSGGGQVLAAGRSGAAPWLIGLRDPRGVPTDSFATLALAPKPGEALSVSTSGDYEHYFEASGVRYHHILDPRTGMPARGLRAATVVAADATLADALSTALLVMGRDAALALVATLPRVEAVLVDDAGRVHASAGLAESLTILHPPAP
jgi:thiamine biosynthesis lipoprotein